MTSRPMAGGVESVRIRAIAGLALAWALALPTRGALAQDALAVGPPDAGAAADCAADAALAASDAASSSQPAASMPARPSIDPALVEQREQLAALVRGELGESFDVGELFKVDLTRPSAIAERRRHLALEIEQIDASIGALQARIATLATDFPVPVPPPRPALLDQPPPAPQSQPSKPPRRQRSAAEARQARAEYQRQLAAYEAAIAEHEVALQAYQTAQQSHAEAEAAYRAQLAERELAIATARAQIDQDLEIARLRREIAAARGEYLDALSRVYGQMSSAAQRSFAFLGARREQLDAHARDLGALGDETAQLAGRLDLIADLATAGRLVGFVVEQQALPTSLREAAEALRQRAQSAIATGGTFDRMARQQEQVGARLFSTLLRCAAMPDRARDIDPLFVEHMRELRRLRRLVHAIEPAAGTAEAGALMARVRAVAAQPLAVGTTDAAGEIVAAAQALLADLDASATANQNSLASWQLAFEREAVTALEGFVSRGTRDASYRLSHEMLEDLRVEALDLAETVLAWARTRAAELAQPARLWQRYFGLSWLLRVTGVLALLYAALVLRRRGRAGLSWLIGRLVRTRLLRRRIGIAVRWGNLGQAVVPTLGLLLIAYGALALLGLVHTEVQIAELFVRWLGLYAIGRALLLGLTRPISRGRPALLAVSPATVVLLQRTYHRLGLFLALVFIATDATQRWIGSGRLQALIDGFFLVWLAVWAIWAAFAWRSTLAPRLRELAPQQRLATASAGWMERQRAGALLSLPVLLLLIGAALYRAGRRVASYAGVIAFLRARKLRRQSRRTVTPEEAGPPAELPPRYLEEFPLYPVLGEGGPLVLPRDALIEQVLRQLQSWRATRVDGSLVLLGEKGIGKTTLTGLIERSVGELPVTTHTWSQKTITEAAVVDELAPLLAANGARTVAEVAALLNDGDDRAILLDEAHNVFLRTIDGYRGFEALVHLVNATSKKVFWVLVFNSFSWQFLNESRRRIHYFRRLLRVPTWSGDEIRELISRRNQRAGFAIEFDEMLLDEQGAAGGDFELVESADSYFRLLREASEGVPRIALYLWLDSLDVRSDRLLRVRLFHEPSLEQLTGLTDDLLYALAAVVQHENLTVEDLGRAMNFSPAFAAFALQYLSEYGVLEPKLRDPQRLTLSPRYYRQTLRLLRTKHLLMALGDR
ncbi:MAG: hypothetical protein JXR83_10815 [Deltaproteobacteria bacterium]|nr:hypothetical protein [Deltaproteobacteria bacterium]